MVAQSLFLGIDVGTTGAKALLIDTTGTLIAESTRDVALSTPQPLWSEQDPREWWTATVGAIRDVLAGEGVAADRVAGVGLTGQMHGLVLLDSSGEPLRPCILWNDQRTGEQCAAITELVGRERLLELTGNPVLPGFTAPKIRWVAEHEPDVYARVAHVLLPKDYVRYRLSGEFGSDVADASGTSLFDVGRRRWSDEMLAALDIPEAWLPHVAESSAVTAKVSAQAASETGLSAGTPIVAGAGDQAAQAVGAGVVQEGVVSATLGTSGVVFAASDRYRVEPQGRLHAFCHAANNAWHLMGVMLSAAGSFRWYRDTLGQHEVSEARMTGGDAYSLLTREAERIPAGCEGLLFLPYLSGERTPHPDPLARGAFIGLTLRHTKAHMTRAVLEGVAFGLADSLNLLRNLGVEVAEVRASGGGAKSKLWRSILADVFNARIVTPKVTQGAAYGAAVLAAVGAGAFASVNEACSRIVQVGDPIEPGKDRSIYAEYYERYRALYPALANEFHKLAELESKAVSK